ncbi:MAG: dTDP-4-dehydrorhamnose reductase [Caldilineaceae bacterium]|nr:dTDP-4-dehydrorhamnose reductase [Caldilineaceae bacterium]
MRILLFGCNGQVGWELQRALAPLGELTALDRNGQDGLCGDLADIGGLRATVRKLRPHLIVNAAAYTAVDQAEADPELATAINATAPGVLAEEASALGALLVHYSTDYVFDGSGSAPWREFDDPAPLCVYGASKWQGEQALLAAGDRHLLLRTQWVYAARGKNFIHSMLRLAAERDALQVVDDQFGAPTGADLIADVTAHAVRQVLANPSLAGTYHLAARGETTWHGYAEFIVEKARLAGWPIRTELAAIVPIPTSDYPTPARRPLNGRLAVAKLEDAFGLTLPEWHSGVARAICEMKRP